MTATFFGNVDLAQVALYSFWLFFAGLVFYLQRENMREGYPTEDDDGNPTNQGLFPMPEPKTFILPGGRGTVSAPDMKRDTREFAMRRVSPSFGSPFEPTGDPMRDGVGPAAYAMRADEPEYDANGHAKIQPMRGMPDFGFSAGKDPRGLAVRGADDAVAGKVVDMWVDAPEAMVRYLEVDLGEGDTRLIPMPMAKIGWKGVIVRAIRGDQFAGVPKLASDRQVTKLEEEKVCAYYAGGKLYATPERVDSQLDPLTV